MQKLLFLIFFGVLAAVLGPYFYRYIRLMGYHKDEVNNFHPGKCKNIPGIETGSEDFELLPDGQILITTNLIWPPQRPTPEGHKGRILLLNLNQSDVQPIEVPIKGDLDLSTFRPAGITKWINKKIKKITILVANIVGPRAVVERFVYSDIKNILYHIETIGTGDPNFFVVDDLAAIGERSFYYTNFHGKYFTWEMAYGLPWGSVGIYDGKQSTLLDEGLAGPNGIALSPDGKYIYVNMCLGEYVRTYRRLADNTLEQIQDFSVPIMPDNVIVTEDGDAWVAGHVIGWKAVDFFSGVKDAVSPTQVIRLKMKDGRVMSSTDAFIDDGHLISGGTVGVVYNNKLVVGTVMWKAAICDMTSDSDQSDQQS